MVLGDEKAMTDTKTYDDLPDFMTVEELAAWLRLGCNTAYEIVRRGDVPHVRFGRSIRIPKTALLIATPKDA
jgi:excisionase family DNA binding protein